MSDTLGSEKTLVHPFAGYQEESLTTKRCEVAEDSVSEENNSKDTSSKGESPPFIDPIMQTPRRTPGKKGVEKGEGQKSRDSTPKGTKLRRVLKTADELRREREAAQRAHRKEVMDAEVAKTTAEYMKRSGGDLGKAAGFWFAREELKRQQPWPTLEEAQAAVENMKRSILDPTKLQFQMEEEEMEKGGKEKGREEKGEKAVKSTQQSLGCDQFLSGINLVGFRTALATPFVYPESYMRETRHREISTSVQEDALLTSPMKTSINPKYASEIPDKQVAHLKLVQKDEWLTTSMDTSITPNPMRAEPNEGLALSTSSQQYESSTTKARLVLGEEHVFPTSSQKDELRTIPMDPALEEKLALSTTLRKDKLDVIPMDSALDEELALSTVFPKDKLCAAPIQTSMDRSPAIEALSEQATPSASTQKCELLTTSTETLTNTNLASTVSDKRGVLSTSTDTESVPVVSGEQVAPSTLLQTDDLLIISAADLVSKKSTSEVSGKKRESSTTSQDVEMPSTQEATLRRSPTGERGVTLEVSTKRKRKTEREELELGAHWTAHLTEDGHRPCVRHR